MMYLELNYQFNNLRLEDLRREAEKHNKAKTYLDSLKRQRKTKR